MIRRPPRSTRTTHSFPTRRSSDLAKVHVVNPVDFDFAFDIAGKQIVSPSRIADALGSAELADAFNGATRAAVLVGAIAETGIHASEIRKAAQAFAQLGRSNSRERV